MIRLAQRLEDRKQVWIMEESWLIGGLILEVLTRFLCSGGVTTVIITDYKYIACTFGCPANNTRFCETYFNNNK